MAIMEVKYVLTNFTVINISQYMPVPGHHFVQPDSYTILYVNNISIDLEKYNQCKGKIPWSMTSSFHLC